MHIKLLVGFFVAGAVIVGGYYFLMNKPVSPTIERTSDSASTTQQGGAFTGSTADLIARGGDWRCTVDASTSQSVSSGITYVSKGKVRADFTTTVAGYGNVESHMIADGVDVYTWSSMMVQGFKTPMTVTESSSTATQSGQSISANNSYNYDCQPWQADQSKFVVPPTITFVATPTQ